MHGVKDIGQAEIHTAEPLVPEPSVSEIELAIGKLKRHKSPGIDQIPAELIIAGGRSGIKQTNNIETYHFCQPLRKFYPTSCCQG